LYYDLDETKLAEKFREKLRRDMQKFILEKKAIIMTLEQQFEFIGDKIAIFYV